MADAAIRVGAGYIEISPRLTGFNRELTREISRRLRATGAGEIQISPVLEKTFSSKLRTLVDKAVRDMGPIELDVKAKLDVAEVEATTSKVSQAAKRAADETTKANTKSARDSAKTIRRAYDDVIFDLRRGFAQLQTSVSLGMKPLTDPAIFQALTRLGLGLNVLHDQQERLTNSQLASVRAGLSEVRRLSAQISRAENEAVQGQQRTWQQHLAGLRRQVQQLEVQVRTSYRSFRDPQVLRFLAQVRQQYAQLSRDSARFSLGDLVDLRAATNELSRFGSFIKRQMDDSGSESGLRWMRGFSTGILSAVGTTLRFGIARVIAIIGAALAVGQQAIGAIGQIAGVLTALGSSAAYAAGSLVSLPAIFAAVAQAGVAVMVGMWGVEEALTALQAADDKSGASAQAGAAAREAAAERVADAQMRLADAQASAIERVESAQARLAEVQEQAAERVLAAQERLADVQVRLAEVQEQALERIAAAQERVVELQARLVEVQAQNASRIEAAQRRLADAQEAAADRVASAERRLQDSHDRSASALDDLNRAREEARERLEDLRLEIEAGALDEEEAQQRIAVAARELEYVLNNPNATREQREAAELKHRQELARLDQIQEKNGDLADELEDYNRDGIEGTDAVIDARERLQDAQQDELDAERELAKARQDGARQTEDAERDLADARTEAAKAYQDALSDIADAERDVNRTRLDGERQVADAVRAIEQAERDLAKTRQDGSKDVAAAEADIARARVDGARDVELAQRDLSRALDDQKDALKQVSTQAQAAEVALSKLSPAGRSFVLFLQNELIPALRDTQWSIQDAFLPPIQRALENSGPLLAVLKAGLTDTGGTVGRLIGQFIAFTNTPFFTGHVESIMSTNNALFRDMDGIAQDLASGLIILTDSAEPFLKWVVDLAKEFANWFDKTMKQKEANGELKRFWDDVIVTLERLLGIVVPLAQGVLNIFTLGKPHGDDMLKLIGNLVTKFKEWTESDEGKRELNKWFESAKKFLDSILKLVEDVVKEFFKFSTEVDLSGIIEALRTDLLPTITDLMENLGGSEGGGLIFLVRLLGGAFDAANKFLAIFRLLVGLFTGDAELVRSSLESIGNTAVREISRAADVLGIDLGMSLDEAKKGVSDTSSSLSGSWANIGKSISDFIFNTKPKLSDFWKSSKETAATESSSMASGVAGGYRDADKAVREKLDPLKQYVPDSWSSMNDDVSKTTKSMQDDLVKKFGLMKDNTSGTWRDLTGSIPAGAKGAQTESARHWVDMSNWMRNHFAELLAMMQSYSGTTPTVGQGIVQGLSKGVAADWPNFIKTISDGLSNAIEWAKSLLGIHSPSTVFRSMGASLTLGLADGVERTQGIVTRAITGLSRAITDSWVTPELAIASKVTLPETLSERAYSNAVIPSRFRVNDAAALSTGRVYNVTLNAAPTTPTERQLVNALSYADALYG
ncbi:hypothetical protein [Nonomuraea zeae]|uniref:hypothetical protein n=1 Tax=Nonomuraea zeae TaxID=1642303 RepID=UPI003614C3AE